MFEYVGTLYVGKWRDREIRYFKEDEVLFLWRSEKKTQDQERAYFQPAQTHLENSSGNGNGSKPRPPSSSTLSLSARGQRATNCSFSRIQRAPGGSKAKRVVVFHSGKCPPHATSIYSTPPLAFSGWKLLWIFFSSLFFSSSSSSSSSFFEGSERSLARASKFEGCAKGVSKAAPYPRKRVIMLMNADRAWSLSRESRKYLVRSSLERLITNFGNRYNKLSMPSIMPREQPDSSWLISCGNFVLVARGERILLFSFKFNFEKRHSLVVFHSSREKRNQFPRSEQNSKSTG